MKQPFAWSFFLLMSCAATAQALDFESLDADRDGRLSVEEAKQNPQVDFFDADSNKDGGIDVEEYRVAVAPSDE